MERTEETKDRIGKGLRKYHSERYLKNPKFCRQCGKILVYNGGRINHLRFCSEDCRKLFHSKLASERGRKSSQVRGRRSKGEIALYEMCESRFSNVKPNYVIAEGWDADIVLLDHKIAIMWNGGWHYQEIKGGLKHSLAQVQNRDRIKQELFTKLGWKVIVYEDRFFTPKEAFEHLLELVKEL